MDISCTTRSYRPFVLMWKLPEPTVQEFHLTFFKCDSWCKLILLEAMRWPLYDTIPESIGFVLRKARYSGAFVFLSTVHVHTLPAVAQGLTRP